MSVLGIASPVWIWFLIAIYFSIGLLYAITTKITSSNSNFIIRALALLAKVFMFFFWLPIVIVILIVVPRKKLHCRQ